MLPFILTVVTLAASISLLLQMIWVGNQGREAATPIGKEEMQKHVIWRSLYVNPDDPRGWVPKTFGFGITVNFRSMQQAYVFVGLVLATLLSAVALTISVL